MSAAKLKDAKRRAGIASHQASQGCGDLPAKWNHAQALASSGHADQAYALYVNLLQSCSARNELEGTAWKAANALPAEETDRLLAEPVFDKPALHKIRTALQLQRMYKENTAGHYASALTYSRALRADSSATLDASAIEVSGWLEDRAHNDKVAESLFRQAISGAKDPAAARMGLALSLMHQERLQEAEAESRDFATPDGKRLHAAIVLARAKMSDDPALLEAALKLVDETGGAAEPATVAFRGWALLKKGRPAEAEAIFAKLHKDAPEAEEYQQGLVYAAAANHDYSMLRLLVRKEAHSSSLASQVLAEHYERMGLYDRAAQLENHPPEGHEAAVQTFFSFDNKSGTEGQDKLSVWTLPQLSAALTPAHDPELSVRVDAQAVRLNDGVRHAWGKQLGGAVRKEIGEGVVVAGVALETPGEGTTQVLGKLQYQRVSENEDQYIRVTASRDAIYDSLRSYEGGLGASAGTGPAVSSSLELAAREPIGHTQFYVGETVAGGAVTAHGTDVNPFYSASLALTRDFSVKGWSWLNAGPEVRLSNYRYDANRYDGAFAGYWSPKSNREAGLVFNAQSEEGGRFLFKTGGRVGYAARQLYTGYTSGAFGEDTTTVAALVSPNLIVGAGAGFRASPGYHDMTVFAWVKVPLESRGHLRAADLMTPRGF
ncbi:hypothetical protein [Paraburkholderia sp. UCT31]|uniref:hypothetical protein n=1 Tax=Paraburkholderia sp. UCT31 TaxID=2615209 RepID=UPI00165604BE|nr:hypothetical protein [Paraburkholderia sp. UCT31]